MKHFYCNVFSYMQDRFYKSKRFNAFLPTANGHGMYTVFMFIQINASLFYLQRELMSKNHNQTFFYFVHNKRHFKVKYINKGLFKKTHQEKSQSFTANNISAVFQSIVKAYWQHKKHTDSMHSILKALFKDSE